VKATSTGTIGKVALVGGPALAVAVAWATASVEDATSIANAALALAIVCVSAALVNAAAGFVTSAVAALALNYFHTEPVHSLRMTESGEIATVLLLVVLGTSVSVATTLRVRSKVTTHRVGESRDAARDLRTLLERGGALPAVWQMAITAACGAASSIDVRLVPNSPAEMPVIGQKSIEADPNRDVVLIPESGAALWLTHQHGALILTPQPGLGAVAATRSMLVQFAASLSSVLSGDTEHRPAP
jgi:hypothetical protein